MTDTPIDKLIFALDGDLTALKAKFAEAEKQAQKTGTAVQANFGAGFKQAANDAASSATALKRALGDIEGSVTNTHGSVATATREFRALFDELTSGRTRQTPGTLAIIATRVFGISGATLAWGAALAAIPAALAYSAIQAESSFSRIQRVLEATGFAAGVTRDQILSIGQAMDSTTKLSEKAAVDIATTLAGRGNVAGAQIPGAVQATYGLSVATGEGYDKSAQMLEKLLADPANGAAELQDQFKLLTAAQIEEIKQLQESGEKDKAQQIIIDSLNDRFKNLDAASWSLARAFDSVGKFFSDFYYRTGQTLARTGTTTDQRVQALYQQQAGADFLLRSHGIDGLAGARSLLAANPSNRELGVGDQALGNIVAQFDARQKQIDTLIHNQTIQDNLAQGGEYTRRQTEVVGMANKVVEGYDHQTEALKKLEAQQTLLNNAYKLAIGPAVQFQDEIGKYKKAVDLAVQGVKDFGDPLKEAQTRAEEQRRINAARPEDRARIQGEVEAQRAFRQAIQNPATSLNAAAIRDLQTQTADMPDRYNREIDTRKRNLQAMQEEAVAARAVAQAYDISTAAADEARIVGEAHTALVKKQIDNEKAYAQALRERAFWTAAAADAQKIENLRQANAELLGISGAGGNPLAIAAAKRIAQAQAATRDEFAKATTPEMRAVAQQHYDQNLAEFTTRDRLTALNGAQAALYGNQQNYNFLQARTNAFGKGFNDDDMRHLEVAQQTFQELISKGIDPAAEENQKLYQQLLQVNTATSDLTDAFQKAAQEAKDLADDITGPLEEFAQKGGNAMDMLNKIGDNLVNTVAKNELFDPLNKDLTGVFGGMLGATADGTMAKPYYVVPMGAGGVPGVGGGDNGLVGSIARGLGLGGGSSPGAGLADLFGGSQAAADASMTDIAELTGDVGAVSGGGGIMGWLGKIFGGIFGGGLAVGGPTKRNQFYMVGENGPELFAPGEGNVIPLSAPTAYSRSGSRGGGDMYGDQFVHVQQNFPNVHDAPGVVRSTSQVKGAVAKAALQGRRNN